LIAEDPDYIISSEDIYRKHSAVSNVRAKLWLSMIDYALIRIYCKRKNFYDLFSFLQSNSIYCINKNNHLTEVIKTLEAENNDKSK